MEAKAQARYLRLAPMKVRLLVRMISGRPVSEAEALLRFTPSRAARAVEKVLKSAIANAENNLELDRATLVVSRATVDQGPVTKRMHPRARGRADVVRRPSSHVTVVVAEPGA